MIPISGELIRWQEIGLAIATHVEGRRSELKGEPNESTQHEQGSKDDSIRLGVKPCH